MKREKPLLFIQKKDIKKLLEQGISEGVFASAAVGIVTGTGKEKQETIAYCGNATLYPEKRRIKKNNYFDLASLTKPLATTLAILSLIKEKKISVDENLSSLLEKKIKGKKNKITARNLLSHEAGFPAYREYFKVLKEGKREEKIRYVENLILKEKLEHDPGSKVLYSDLGFILLGIIIEKKAGCPQDKYVEEKVFKPLKLEKKIFYKPLYQEKKIFRNTDFVATEIILEEKGEMFDPDIVDAFMKHEDTFLKIRRQLHAKSIID